MGWGWGAAALLCTLPARVRARASEPRSPWHPPTCSPASPHHAQLRGRTHPLGGCLHNPVQGGPPLPLLLNLRPATGCSWETMETTKPGCLTAKCLSGAHCARAKPLTSCKMFLRRSHEVPDKCLTYLNVRPPPYAGPGCAARPGPAPAGGAGVADAERHHREGRSAGNSPGAGQGCAGVRAGGCAPCVGGTARGPEELHATRTHGEMGVVIARCMVRGVGRET